MKSFDEIRKAGIIDARTALAGTDCMEGLTTAFSEWWRHQARVTDAQSHREHPAAGHLADALRAADLEAAANFAAGPWSGEGPIDPGVWLFAIVLGESFGEPFVDALVAGSWRDPTFFGLEQYGAWDAFDTLMRDRLLTTVAGDAAVKRLRSSVEKVRADPLAILPFDKRRREQMKVRIEQYAVSPDIDEVYEQPSDLPAFFDDSFLWNAMIDIRPSEALALLGDMPHPIFMRLGQHERLIERPEKIGELIMASPKAFNASGAFQSGGAVAVLLLDIATAAIERTALDADGKIIVAPSDEPELLLPTVEKCQATIKTILDSFFSRDDAALLAWAWLEHIISKGKMRGRWGAPEGRAVNLPALVTTAVAERLPWRPDWKEWILKREKLWRINRLSAVVSVGLLGKAREHGQPADALEWALIEADLGFAGIGDAIADVQNLTAAIGGGGSV